MIECLILLYYAVVLTGMLACGANIAGYFYRNSPVPLRLQWLLSLGFCPVVISWLGLAGFFRLSGITGWAGIAFASYALWRRRALYQVIRSGYRDDSYSVWFIAIIIAISSIPKWCYLYGGINNSDEFRSIALTASFAANYLKPAFPFNFSIPISYSYYLYQIPAFLYATLSGYLWPSLAVVMTGIMAIIFFYIVFALYIKAVFPQSGKYTVLIGFLCITFFGLDVFVYTDLLNVVVYPHSRQPPEFPLLMSIDHWNGMQITSMAAYHYWVYQYLLSLAYALAALYALGQYWYHGHRHWLTILTACTAFCLTFGAITGIWLCAVIALYGIIGFCFAPQRIIPAIRCIPAASGILVVIMLPQLFTFIGRDPLVYWTAPVFWFTREYINLANWRLGWKNIIILAKEFGPVLTVGCLMIPLYAWPAIRRRQYFLIAILCMAIVSCVGATITTAVWNDWFWRGCNLFIIVAAAIGMVWLYEHLRRVIPLAWLHTLILMCLIPGMVNYFAESYFRWSACTVPSSTIRYINDSLSVHSVFFNNVFSNNTTLLGGRAYFDTHPQNFGRGYHNSDDFLTDWLHVPENQTPCDRSWFGSALPNGVMGTISSKKKFEIRTCTTIKK